LPIAEILKRLITSEKGLYYLKIIINGSKHLAIIIEDALDMSRIENNKFEVNKDLFCFRTAVEDVCDIMKF